MGGNGGMRGGMMGGRGMMAGGGGGGNWNQGGGDAGMMGGNAGMMGGGDQNQQWYSGNYQGDKNFYLVFDFETEKKHKFSRD